MEIDKVFNNDVDGVADNLFSAVKNSVSEVKVMQQRKAAENVQLVMQSLKKIESDIRDRFDGVGTAIENRVASIKDGRDGINGKDGRDGKDGRPGRDGPKGDRGIDGQPGRDGVDGVDGISVINAQIDFDGSLIIGLSDGKELNVGEVVSQDVAEKIKVINTMSTNAAVAVKEEGTTITNGVKSLNFVGAGVTATTSGDDVTVTVAGGGGSGTVTSVALSGGTTGLTVTGSPITTTGTITLAGTLATANGGTNLTSFTSGGVVYASSTSALATGSALVFDGTNFSNGAVWTTNPLRPSQPQYFQFGTSSTGLVIAANGTAFIQAMRFSDNGSGTNLILSKGRGTYASPTAVASGDAMGTMDFRAYGGTTSRTLASISGFVDTYTSDSNISSYLTFGVSPSGSASTAEQMRLDSSGNLTLQKNMSVGAATPTTSGAGITFPATQSASTDANTLDDYEEGTITSSNLGLAYATPGTSSFTYSDRFGTYTKIGRVVYFTIDIRVSAFSKGTASGDISVVGLPFAQRNTGGYDNARCVVKLYNWTYTTSPVIGDVGSGLTSIGISRMVSNSASVTIDDPAGGSIIWVTGFYFV
jgi:hypothetical protein